jgi:hypothetical protein
MRTLLEQSRRMTGNRTVESLPGGRLGRAKASGGVNLQEGGREVQMQAGSIRVCRAVGKSLDLFRCANTQKDPI